MTGPLRKIRCWLNWCPCELKRFGKDKEELWACCIDCGQKRVWMNENTPTPMNRSNQNGT